MINSNKRGQQGIISGIFIGIIVLFVLFIGVTAFINSDNGSGFWSELGPAAESVSTGFMGVFGPLFNGLLGLDSAGNNAFLMVLVFILISIVIVSTLDSVNMFGDDGKGKTTNFLIGIIVSIIGVRFMPSNLWESLTAPSSAFVATILIGIPFLAFFFVTMKLKSLLASKLLWLFFLVTTGYLVGRTAGEFVWMYLIFMLLAGLMLFFDSTVRKFFKKMIGKEQLNKIKSSENLKSRYDLKKEMKRLYEIASNPQLTSREDADEAMKEYKKLERKYNELAD